MVKQSKLIRESLKINLVRSWDLTHKRFIAEKYYSYLCEKNARI